MVLGVIMLGTILGANAQTPSAQSTVHSVRIEGMKYTPEHVTVHVGDQIEWTNYDIVPHTVTALPSTKGRRVFNSGMIKSGETFRYVVKSLRSNINYVCSYHPTMKGSIGR